MRPRSSASTRAQDAADRTLTCCPISLQSIVVHENQTHTLSTRRRRVPRYGAATARVTRPNIVAIEPTPRRSTSSVLGPRRLRRILTVGPGQTNRAIRPCYGAGRAHQRVVSRQIRGTLTMVAIPVQTARDRRAARLLQAYGLACRMWAKSAQLDAGSERF